MQSPTRNWSSVIRRPPSRGGVPPQCSSRNRKSRRPRGSAVSRPGPRVLSEPSQMTTNQGTARFTLTGHHAQQVTADYTSSAWSLDPPRSRTFDVAPVDAPRVGSATNLSAGGRDLIRRDPPPTGVAAARERAVRVRGRAAPDLLAHARGHPRLLGGVEATRLSGRGDPVAAEVDDRGTREPVQHLDVDTPQLAHQRQLAPGRRHRSEVATVERHGARQRRAGAVGLVGVVVKQPRLGLGGGDVVGAIHALAEELGTSLASLRARPARRSASALAQPHELSPRRG